MEKELITEMRRTSELSEELLIKAKEELGETDNIREESLILIKEWIPTQINDYSNLDDLSIRWFLRGCKFDSNKTKVRIETFYSFRSKVTEWYSNRDPLLPELMELLNLGTILPLPGRDDEGRKVIVIRASIHDPYKHKQDDVLKIMNMVVELLCRDDEAISVTGVVCIVDLKGVGMGHAMQMTPSMIRKAVNSWQDVNPIRTKAMHYINTPLNVHVIMNIFKTFMKEKLRRRLHLHRGDVKKVLVSLIPCDILPPEYGGRGLSVESISNEWKERVISNRDWFMNPEKHGPFSPF
ncbi:retinol-binding protein pinta-like [Daphnia pulicaria]|uniref:retinol-binding protein pinta-like n=1 Tax=Daphnia pulicaria TaxID=35523 RepID=UPI001EEA20B3|nr:retinol-binding protein pinta-like [Daphnia pulicaria]XP_046652813.1 retinol-binding protein pinta-like [Daphnia pulicaria]XP_046652823.1 retinol-binding protein pinta-like [Daphnia pulicaria]